ncbi:hypothetical protein N9Z79_06460 [Akkermansiaceae bacterium]|nr:hypothetical protein [Akkermansiaceae bacterium]
MSWAPKASVIQMNAARLGLSVRSAIAPTTPPAIARTVAITTQPIPMPM